MNVAFNPGAHISQEAERLVAIAREHECETVGVFNEIELRATADTKPEDVVAEFGRRSVERAEAYRNSPEGKAAAREREQRRQDAQSDHDALMRTLPTLDFNNRGGVLDWLCAMQGPSDHMGVIVRRDTIVETFAKHDLRPGVNCGSGFKRGDATNEYEWLVGQALSGLKDGPAIHGIIHKFASEWKERFEP